MNGKNVINMLFSRYYWINSIDYMVNFSPSEAAQDQAVLPSCPTKLKSTDFCMRNSAILSCSKEGDVRFSFWNYFSTRTLRSYEIPWIIASINAELFNLLRVFGSAPLSMSNFTTFSFPVTFGNFDYDSIFSNHLKVNLWRLQFKDDELNLKW